MNNLQKDYRNILPEELVLLPNTYGITNVVVDIGTSMSRSVSFDDEAGGVSGEDIIRIPNPYSILSENDLVDCKSMEFDDMSLENVFALSVVNTTNEKSPIYNKPLTISKGALNKKLCKSVSNYSVSNQSKYNQPKEFAINVYSLIASTLYSNYIEALKENDANAANKLVSYVCFAFMLPDEEKLESEAQELRELLKGTIEFEFPLLKIRGSFKLDNSNPNQRLDIYGEAESVIYYYLLKFQDERSKAAFLNHGVAVIDVGEGSIDCVYFLKKELISRASSTNRDTNGRTLIARTLRNIKSDLSGTKEKNWIKPDVEALRLILEENDDLLLETSLTPYDISEAFTKAKIETAGEIANIFKESFEQNTSFGVNQLFLIVLAGRAMIDNPKSPSLGKYLAVQISDNLSVPSEIVKITPPDSNLLGAGLKLLMKKKSKKR